MAGGLLMRDEPSVSARWGYDHGAKVTTLLRSGASHACQLGQIFPPARPRQLRPAQPSTGKRSQDPPRPSPAIKTLASTEKNAGRIVNPKGSIWYDLPMATGIATLVSYAGVFGDVIGIEEMAARLGVAGQDEFYAALHELHREGKIILQDGFAGLPDLDEKIRAKAAKIELADQLIGSQIERLRKLGKSRLIKFVGISGSLAAKNPVRDKDKHLDIDIFLITRNQCLWLCAIALKTLQNLIPGKNREPEWCINYIMDESDLMVTNRNFFTATEILNTIPVSGPDTYRTFLQANAWVDYYYPGASGAPGPTAVTRSSNLVNRCLYVVYTGLCCIRYLNLDRLSRLSFKADARGGYKFNRHSARSGGYQALVLTRFTRLATDWFPDLIDAGLIGRLFPDELSVALRTGETNVHKIYAELGAGFDYSKYGYK